MQIKYLMNNSPLHTTGPTDGGPTEAGPTEWGPTLNGAIDGGPSSSKWGWIRLGISGRSIAGSMTDGQMSDTFCGSLTVVLSLGDFGVGISGMVLSDFRDCLEVSRIEVSSMIVLMSGLMVDMPTLDLSVTTKQWKTLCESIRTIKQRRMTTMCWKALNEHR